MVVTLASHNGDLYSCEGVRLRFSGTWAAAVAVEWFANGERIGGTTAYPDGPDAVCAADMKRFDTVALTFERSAVPENRLGLELAELSEVWSPALRPGDAVTLPTSFEGEWMTGRIETLRYLAEEGPFRAEITVR
jgi:hypothetical protein